MFKKHYWVTATMNTTQLALCEQCSREKMCTVVNIRLFNPREGKYIAVDVAICGLCDKVSTERNEIIK